MIVYPLVENRREFIKQLPKDFKVGVEVGVRDGHYSKFMLENTNMTIYSVDPWENNAELSNAPQVYEYCKKLLSPFGERSKMFKMTSLQASKLFSDKSLDFVYIDALHDYQNVKQDLECWWPKVKKMGIIAGHDMNLITWDGLYRAVMEFFTKLQKPITLCDINRTAGYSNKPNEEYDGKQPSWFVVKK